MGGTGLALGLCAARLGGLGAIDRIWREEGEMQQVRVRTFTPMVALPSETVIGGTFIVIYLHSMNPPPAPHIPYMEVHPRVVDAIASGVPVVAMETTIVTHGMPYPENLKYDCKLRGVFVDF